MALKPILDADEVAKLPDALKAEYEPHDGKFHLSVELADNSPWKPVAKLVNTVAATRRERDTAVSERAALKTERDALATERDGFKTKVTDLEAARGAEDPAFKQYREANEQRIAALEKANAEEKQARQQAEVAMAEQRFVDELRREAAPFVREEPGVLDDFIERRLRPHFQRDEKGNFIPKEGDTVIYSEKNPGQPMTAKEFIAARAVKAPEAAYQLRQNRGPGVPGNNGAVVNTSQFTIRRGAPHDEYVAQKAAAEKAGQRLQVVDP